MANIAYVRRVLSSLKPIDEVSEEAIREIPKEEVVRITWSRPRNPKFHRKFFALLKAGMELQDHFTDLDSFRFWLTLKAGYYDVVVTPNGEVIFKPRSISFGSMDEDGFEKLYNKVIDILIKEFGATKEDVERILEFA